MAAAALVVGIAVAGDRRLRSAVVYTAMGFLAAVMSPSSGLFDSCG